MSEYERVDSYIEPHRGLRKEWAKDGFGKERDQRIRVRTCRETERADVAGLYGFVVEPVSSGAYVLVKLEGRDDEVEIDPTMVLPAEAYDDDPAGPPTRFVTVEVPADLSLDEGSVSIFLHGVDESGLLPDEAAVMGVLCDAQNAYVTLPMQHPSEQRDFTDAIHVCQQMLALRVARRCFPQGWPNKGGGS